MDPGTLETLGQQGHLKDDVSVGEAKRFRKELCSFQEIRGCPYDIAGSSKGMPLRVSSSPYLASRGLPTLFRETKSDVTKRLVKLDLEVTSSHQGHCYDFWTKLSGLVNLAPNRSFGTKVRMLALDTPNVLTSLLGQDWHFQF